MPAPRGNIILSQRQYRGQIRVDVTEGLKRLEKISKQITVSQFAEIMDELGQIGVESMQESIINPKPEHDAPFSSLARQLGVNKGNGRYRTGKMYNSVGSRFQVGAKTIKVIVGYLKGQFEDYFKYQDRGFWNKWKLVAVGEGYNGRVSSGPNAPRGLHFEPRANKKWTEGTFALRDARQKMVDAIPDVIQKAEKKIHADIRGKASRVK